VLLPISTNLRSSFGASKLSAFVFGVNLTFISGLNLLLWTYAIRKRWLPGFDARIPAMLLDLAPSLYSLGLFLGALAVIPWRPAVALATLERCVRGTPGKPCSSPDAKNATPADREGTVIRPPA
jgi:hypothetical protein